MSIKAFLSVLLLTLSVSAKSADIELWHAHQAQDFVVHLAEQFEAETGQKIRISAYKTSRVKAELLLGAKNNVLPDIIFVPSDFLGLYHELKLNRLDDSWLDPAISAGAKDTAIVDGKLFGVPVIQGNHLMLYYNKSLVDEPAATWQQLFEQKDKLSSKGVRTIGWNYGEMFWFVAFLGAYGSTPITNGEVTLDTPQMVAALRFYQSLGSRGLIDPACDYNCAQKDFVERSTAYSINGDWAYADLSDELGEDLGLAILPAIDDKPLKPFSSTFTLAFPRVMGDSKRQAVLRQFARFVQTEAIQRQTYQHYQLLPTNSIVFNALKQSVSGQQRLLLQQLAMTNPMPSEAAMAIVWQAMAMAYKRFVNNGYTPEQTAQYMQQVAEKELARFMASR
ncbi:extracellular solute-binding protein [Neiella sp. HB171785]|uniref:Extracellular solute-binding protein n=1 Tax=Neiella litorisoli TaxID=2771431 RepID=A0A8J6QLA6_9GAMM|nr:extracellular solute-binding protein [Neiella litorisoli]MBD1390237.1 extracellular solute-binding protein [Neiella litorisoli]